jgi:ribosomal protein L31E
MDKQEYLKNRFKKDFLQYSLQQEDSLPAKEIAEKLYGVIDLNWLIGQGKQEIESLCNKHLSFEKVKVDGKLSNELSQELGYDLKDRIIAEYQNYLDSHSIDEITTAIISKIERSIELQTWSNGIVNMQEAIKLLVERVNNSSRSYGNLYTAPISENDILEKFNKAKKNTLLERIEGNNIDDIIEYRSALMKHVRVSCENMDLKKLNRSLKNLTKTQKEETIYRYHLSLQRVIRLM